MKRIIITLTCLLSLTSMASMAQQAAIRIDTVISQPGNNLLLPVYFSGFSNVGSITLYISFNSGSIQFKQGVNWYGAFDNGFNFANSSGSVIAITCLNYAGVTQSDGKLLDLKINFSGTPGILTFQSGCEITDIYGIPLSPAPLFQAGLITRPLAAAITSPKATVCLGDSTSLTASGAGGFGSYTYQWSSLPPGFTSALSNPVVSPEQSTRFIVTVSDIGGLSDTTSILIATMTTSPPGQVTIQQPAEGDSGLLNPVTFSWDPAQDATDYTLTLWPEGSEEPEIPAASGPGLLNFTPPSDLTEGLTHFWRVNTANACLETTGEVHQFTMMPLPNLRITQAEISQPAAGQVMQVTWTVKNDGQGPTTTPVWYDKIWISENLSCADDNWNTILLGQFPNISALNPGESYTQTKNIVLPENLIGNYFVFVITDAMDVRDIQFNGPPPVPYAPPPFLLCWSLNRPRDPVSNAVKEVGEEEVMILNTYQQGAGMTLGYYHDNFFYVPAFLSAPPVPDLVVTQIVATATTFSGQLVNLSYTVKNQGEVSPVQQSWKDKIYLSTDTSFSEGNSLLLSTITRMSGLYPDSTYTVSTNVLIPPEFSGKFFFYVFTDATKGIYEYIFDGNNITRSDTLTVYLSPPPDLAASGIITPTSISAGQRISVKYTVTNEGGSAPVAERWTDQVFLCPFPDFDADESKSMGVINLTHQALPPGSSYTREENADIPRNITGNHYFYAFADKQNNVFEFDMEENNMIRSNPVLVINPDLVTDAFDIPAENSEYQQIDLQFTVRNLGPGKLMLSRPVFRLYLCPDAAFNPEAATVISDVIELFTLESNATKQISATVTIPDVSSGYHYLYIEADALNEIYEPGNESNNITRSNNSILIRRADLEVGGLVFPPTALSGNPVIIRSILRNNGQGTVPDTVITNRITLSLTPEANPGSDLVLLTSTRPCNLAPGDSILFEDTLVIPPDLSGNWFVTYAADWTNVVKEGEQEENNILTHADPLLILPGPVPNLQCISFTLPDTITAGVPFEAVLTVKNAGTRSILGQTWQENIYWSALPDWIDQSLHSMAVVEVQPPLLRDSSYQRQLTLLFPDSVTSGTYYLYIRLDGTDKIFERDGELDNQAGPFTIITEGYPLDLAVTAAYTNNDTLGSGSTFNISYTLYNNSPVSTISGSWRDAIYASADEVFNPSQDQLLGDWTKTGDLGPGDSVTLYQIIRIPPSISGSYYLLLVCDHTSSNPDIDRQNNYLTLGVNGQTGPIIITLLPTADFSVTSLTAPVQALTGQPFTIEWTVANEGDSAATSGWKDKLYLSSDNLVNSGDILLGQHGYSNSIVFSPGDFYNDSITIGANPAILGNYWVIVRTDAEDEYYEHQKEGNNTAAGLVLFRHAPPSDLLISQASVQPVTTTTYSLSWTILNTGNNPVTGTLKDGIYLSADSIFSSDDLLWCTVTRPINLAGGETQARDTLIPQPGMAAGMYYVIFRTDVIRAFQETDEENNTFISPACLFDVPEIFFDIPVTFTMENLATSWYKLVVPDSLAGETFVLDLSGDSLNGFNEIYASYETIPNRIHHDHAYAYFMEGNQELYIPELRAGTYYFLITGTTLPGQDQDITLLASILDFEIRTVDQDRGGTPGPVTVMIYGSKFTEYMTFFLVRDSVMIAASRMEYINATQVMTTFNLTTTGQGYDYWTQYPVPTGFYDVIAVNSTGDTATLEDGFEVMPYSPSVLLENLVYPPYVRPYTVFYMSIQFTNTGNNDIPLPTRTLLSLMDHAIAFKPAELPLLLRDLFLEFKEPGGPADVLRPGARCEIRIFCKSGKRGKIEFLLTR